MALSAGSVEIRLFAELARLQSDMKKANKVVEDAMGGIQKTVRATTTVFNRLAGAFSASAIVKIADDYKRFDAQLKLSTKSLNEYNEAYANVIRIGRTAQSDIGAIGVLYARLNNNLRDFNVTQNQVASVAETISLALRTNNATVQETNSVMLQLSQSFGSGKLNGQEFLAVAEGAPMLLRQLATSLKVPYGALKDLSAQGLITRDALLKAWSDPAYIASLREQVKQVGTVTSSITVLMNNLKQYIGEADKATSVTKTLSAGITLIADNINLLVSGAIAYGLVAFAKWTQSQYEALRATQANNAQKVIAAKVELSLAQALYASGGAVSKQTVAMANNAAATTLATSNTARLIAAQQGLNAVTSVSATAIRGLGTILSAFGGWIGLAITGAVLFADKLVLLYDKVRGLTPEMKALNDEMERRNRLEKSGINANSASAQQEEALVGQVKLYNEINAQITRQNSLIESRKNYGLSVTKEEAVLADLNKQLRAQSSLMGTNLTQANQLTPSINENADAFGKLSEKLQTAKELAAEYAKNQALIIIEGSKLGLSQSEITAKLSLLKEQYDKATGAAKENKKAIKDANEELKREGEVRKYLFNLQQELDNEATKRYNQAVGIRAKDDKEEFERKSEMMKALQKQANENYKESQRVVEEQAKEVERVNNRLYNNLARSLTDSIVRGFEQGLSFIDNFKQTIKNAFKSFVVNVGVNFVQQGLQGLFGGLTGRLFASMGSAIASGSASASSLVDGSLSGGGSVFNSTIGLAKNVFSAFNGGMTSAIESFGSKIASFGVDYFGQNSVLAKVGGTLGQYASTIGPVLGYAGLALSAVSVVKSLFGSKKSTPRYSSGVSTMYENGQFTSTNLSRIAGFNKDAGGRDAMTSAAEAFSKTLGGLLGAFGINQSIGTNLQFFRRKGAWGWGSATVDGVQAEGTGRVYNRNQQQAFEQFINAFLTTGLVNAIKVSKLPEGLKALFNGITDRTQLGNMINAVAGLGKAQDSLIKLYSLTASQAGRVSVATGLAGDELIAFVNKLSSVGLASRTVGDVLIDVRNTLIQSFGGTMYNSLTEFDSALKGIDKTTQDGIETFANLFALRDEFAQFQTQIDNLKSGVRGALFEVVSESEKQAMRREDLAKMFADLNREVPASIQELIALGKSIDYTTAEGLNLALVFPALVDAFNQTEQGVKSLMGTLNASYFTTRADMLSANASDNPRAFVKGQAETNASLLAEIKQMKTDNADMKAIMAAVVEYTRQQQRIIDDWDVNGMPAERVA